MKRQLGRLGQKLVRASKPREAGKDDEYAGTEEQRSFLHATSPETIWVVPGGAQPTPR